MIYDTVKYGEFTETTRYFEDGEMTCPLTKSPCFMSRCPFGANYTGAECVPDLSPETEAEYSLMACKIGGRSNLELVPNEKLFKREES